MTTLIFDLAPVFYLSHPMSDIGDHFLCFLIIAAIFLKIMAFTGKYFDYYLGPRIRIREYRSSLSMILQ